MVTIEARRVVHEHRARSHAAYDDARVLWGNGRVVDADTGQLVAVQTVAVPSMANRLAQLLRHVRLDDAPVAAYVSDSVRASQARASGIATASTTFGYRPPVGLRRRWNCGRCSLDSREPAVVNLLGAIAEQAWAVFLRDANHQAERTDALVAAAGIGQAWRLGSTPWTSGVINGNTAHPYHRDRENVKGTWSAMLACKRGVEGGWLHLADWDVWLEVPNGSITIFDGQAVLHGVSPFRRLHPAGYRYTVVWYARAGMARCAADPADELRRAQLAATAADERRRLRQDSVQPR
jgi:hypothetical protein